jgi:hypothetical protein
MSLSWIIGSAQRKVLTAMKWAQTVAAANKQIFSGSPESIEQLTQMIIDGRVLGESKGEVAKPTPLEDLEIQKFVEQAIYASLIPKAWSMSNEEFRPVILDSGEPCTGENPLPEYMTDEVAEATSVCYQDRSYYFVSASGDFRRCDTSPGGIISCTNQNFKALAGMKALDEGTFGDVTKTDLVIG